MSNLVRKNSVIILVVLAAVLLLSTSGYRDRAGSYEGYGGLSAVMEELSRLEAPVAAADGVVCSIAMANEVRQVYQLFGAVPVWTGRKGLNGEGLQLMELIENLHEYGLEPDTYHFGELKKLTLNGPESRATVEILLTDAALRLMVNLRYGLLSDGIDTVDTEEFRGLLAEGFRKRNPVEAILAVQPSFYEYVQLQRATARYVQTTVINSDSLAVILPVRDSALLFSQVKKALVRMGYAGKKTEEARLGPAIRAFQKHHGLEADGHLGKNTLEAMNMTTAHHYRMLALNLDRLRKHDPATGRMLWVNIPAYRLKVFEDNHLHDTYKVIVGAPKTPTPVLESAVIRVITNPVWLVPPSITRKEMLPRIMSDSNYMNRNRLRIVNSRNQPVDLQSIEPGLLGNGNSGYRIRQDAGTGNALGSVKFIFPNNWSVYLHDTPAKTLFTKDLRALSHGCVRVQNPGKLADYLVQPGWTGKTPVSALIAAGKRREIGLQEAVPIRITYLTCEGSESGEAFFYKDVYRKDLKEMEALARIDD